MSAFARVHSDLVVDLSRAAMPAREYLAAPVEEPDTKPTTTPAKPDTETEPNTVPAREPLQEPDVAPCERPGTSCPVR
jgi:hypothetical protein